MSLGLGKIAKIVRGDMFDAKISEATVVHLYLLQETNDKIRKKLKKELKPGTRIVSSAFTLTGWKPVQVDPRGPIYGPLYLYKV